MEEEYVFDPQNPLKLRRKRDVAGVGTDDEEYLEDDALTRKRPRNALLDSYDSDSDSQVSLGSDDSTRSESGTGRGDGEDATQGKWNDHEDEDKNDDMFDLEDSDKRIPTGNASNSHRHGGGPKLLNIEEFKRENLQADNGSNSTNNRIPEAFQDEEASTRIEAFDIEEELKHGVFDKDGNYIEVQDKEQKLQDEQDKWIDEVEDLEGVSEAQKREKRYIRQQARNFKENTRHFMLDEALIRLFYLVEDEENVSETLARFNKLRQTVNKSKSNDHKTEMTIMGITNSIDLITDLLGILEFKGIGEVYDLDRNSIQELIKEESLSNSSIIDDYKDKIWGFKWIKDPHGKVQEYYSNYEMQYWKQSYFHDNVLVKYKDDADIDKNWLHVSCMKFL